METEIPKNNSGKIEVFNLESRDLKRFAPSSAVAPPALSVDKEFQKELEKIPDKLAFKIGEVAKIVGVKTYVLRYWEAEFDALKPEKSRHNQRVYSRKDVETVMMIKKLLYKDKQKV
jgi:hypothetical protein